MVALGAANIQTRPLSAHDTFVSGDHKRAFVAIGYAQYHLCRQPHAKKAIYGVSTQLTWVDVANIKINPIKKALQVVGSY